MRKLYWEVCECYITTKHKKLLYVGRQNRKLRYKDEKETITRTETVRDWDRTFDILHCCHDRTLFKQRPFLKIMVRYPSIKIYEDEYIEHIYETNYHEYNCDWTFFKLMDTLSVDEFIVFCKDNGLNVCPIERK